MHTLNSVQLRAVSVNCHYQAAVIGMWSSTTNDIRISGVYTMCLLVYTVNSTR